MAFIQTHFHNTVTDTVSPIITSLGEAGIGWIVLSLVLLLLFKNAPHRWFGAYRHDGHAAGELTLKNIICRLRPCNVFTDFPMLIARPTSYSFPSGHNRQALPQRLF